MGFNGILVWLVIKAGVPVLHCSIGNNGIVVKTNKGSYPQTILNLLDYLFQKSMMNSEGTERG
jgi:hypothetical protein